MAKCFGSYRIPWLLLYLAVVCAAGLQQTSNPRIVEHPEDQFVAKNEPATLNCKAEGEPPPVITWYRNGLPVITANENPSSHRMLLPSGQLFFLRIIHNKNTKPDVGVYYCNATNPETRVSVVSKNATLEIAVLASEFREQPRSTEVAMGSDAFLECRPPKGEPEPRMRWKKDGEAVKPSERFSVSESGTLRIKDVRRDDGGIYVCVAYNIGGEKDSVPARLSVREKPRIVEGPKDVLVHENVDVYFQCRAIGDPEPTIIWKKVDDQMPQGRLHILEDRSLKIERARQSDEGTYICRAENSVGWLEAEAKLTVHSQPSFIVTPHDKTVGIGRRAMFRCEVTGNPLPTIFWNKESSQKLMFPNQDHGRISVSEDGTLIIESVEKEDAGEYICKGLSIAGSAYAKAKLEVRDVDSRPPPIIHHGPQNQTLPLTSPAFLRCSASGDPAPLIRWYKNGRILPVRDPRFTIHDSGTLQIQDLRRVDTGLYTCKAISETGETSWSAALLVETPSDTSVIFHRTPEPTAFPGPPSKPSVSDVTETSMRLTWRANGNHGASPVSAYTVEYFSHETGEGWIVASDAISEPSCVVEGLRQETAYMFLVRAQNSHGLSLPSHVTAPVRTKGSGSVAQRPSLAPFDLTLVEEKLSGQTLSLVLPEAMSSTAVKLTWEVRKNQRFIEGFHVRYRTMAGSSSDDDQQQQQQQQQGSATRFGPNPAFEWTVETVQSNADTTYDLLNLEKYTWYEINVQPFYSTVVGHESNTVRVRTFEDVPNAPPANVQVKMVDNSTIYLTWEPPPKQNLNGALRGYKIFMFGSESKFDREIPINSTLEGIFIHHVVKDMTYKIQMAAFNRMGDGARSDPVQIGPQVAHKNIVKEPWFVATLIGVVGGVVWLALCVLSVWLYRRRRRKGCKKMPKNIHPGVAVYKTHDGIGNGSAINEALETTYLQKDANAGGEAQYMNSASIHASAGLKTFHNNRAAHLTTPYATTNLLSNGGCGGGGGGGGGGLDPSAFRPIHHSYVIQQAPPGGGRNSVDSGVKHDISSMDSINHGGDMPGSSGFYHQLEPCDFVHKTANSSLYAHQHHIIQPVLFLPPPPEHPPPPSEAGTPPDSPSLLLPSYGNYMAAELKLQQQQQQQQQQQKLNDHPHHHHRRHVIPESEEQRNYRAVGLFDDDDGGNCATVAPPRHLIESQLTAAAAAARVYSPHAMSEPEYGPSTGNRAYKLVPMRDDAGGCQRHFSDSEGAPAPAFRGATMMMMMMSHEYSPPSPAPEDPMMLSLGSVDPPVLNRLPKTNPKCNTAAAAAMTHRSSSSPISEIGMQDEDCHGLDEYSLEAIEPRPRGGSQSPQQQQSFSDNDDEEEEEEEEEMDAGIDPTAAAAAAAAAWNDEGPHHQDSDTNCSSLRSSAGAASSDDDGGGGGGGSFRAKLDFASAVAKAAKMSGLTVVNNAPPPPPPLMTSASGAKEREKVKKVSKHHRQRARCTSPYSTDSNYSSVNLPPHKPYPKSERRRQLRDHHNKAQAQPNDPGPAAAADPRPIDRVPVLTKSQSFKQHESEVPPYNKPCFPNGSGSGRQPAAAAAAGGQKPSSSGVASSSSGGVIGGGGAEFDVSPNGNPVNAFDTRNMTIA